MTQDDMIRWAREAQLPESLVAHPGVKFAMQKAYAAGQAAERQILLSEIQRLTSLANTAEKWRGIALSRDGDGRTVQQVQEEARAEEREACALECIEIANDENITPSAEACAYDCAEAIRARK